MTLSNRINASAIFLGPMITVWMTIFYQNRREKQQLKLDLFKTLVAYRLQFPITREFVASLNQIDIIFHDEKRVIDAWRRCFDTLNNLASNYDARKNSIVDLIHEMGQTLGFKPVRQTAYLQPYTPQQFEDDRQRQFELETELIRVLKNSHAFDGVVPYINASQSDNG